jgi:hypothetical protein
MLEPDRADSDLWTPYARRKRRLNICGKNRPEGGLFVEREIHAKPMTLRAIRDMLGA